MTTNSEISKRAILLLVDDDADFLQAVALQIEDHGNCDVYVAADGVEAIGQIEALSRIDALITDFHMPEASGAVVARAFHDRFPGKPVILSTAISSTDGRVADFLKTPNSKFMGKPFSVVDLGAALRELGVSGF